MRFTSFLRFTTLLLGTEVAVLAAPAENTEKRDFAFSELHKLALFGDSWTDMRFDVAGTQPSDRNPFGNIGKTSSKGKMWPEYLATKYNSSLVLGYNLALSGAVVDVDIIPTAPHDVDYQVHEKFEPYSNQTNFFPKKTSLFTMWVGNNDINRSFNGTDPTINVKIIARYEELVRHLYDIGARNFLFLSVPPMWRFPSNTENPDVDLPKLQRAVEDYNRRLKRMAREIDHNLPYSTVYYYDIPPLLNAIIDDPSQFAETAVYKNTTGWCSAYNA
ncbi:hypothetical protein ASPCAL15001 [Aspergillus calidoustus]|uniref:Uncharacterized protein n=1 Tax=Aspergillus calidoustus TaxID=454130 RepID=A0A0U5GJE2_ASPCI|nr:hypothetical protein ASPCAL15001 [Aspergillus calidoustus]